VLGKELEHSLIAALIFSLDTLAAQVATRSHEAVDLVIIALHLLRHRQTALKRPDRIRVLVTRCNHEHRDFDAWSLARINHGWVALSAGREQAGVHRAGNRNNLAPPAEAEAAPLLNLWVLVADSLDNAGNLANRRRRSALGLEEATKRLLLLRGVWRHPGEISGLAIKEIGHEDEVLVLLVRVGENIGALESLIEVAKDIEDEQDGLGRCGRASHICKVVSLEILSLGHQSGRTHLRATNRLISTLGLVALGDDGSDIAARS